MVRKLLVVLLIGVVLGFVGCKEPPDEGQADSITPVSEFQAKAKETINEENLSAGREAYEIFCSSCHGPAGDGQGHLFTSNRYPYPPASLITDEAKALKDGEIYHSITVGYGIMGAHGGMIRQEDRWKIILHIRAYLQK